MVAGGGKPAWLRDFRHPTRIARPRGRGRLFPECSRRRALRRPPAVRCSTGEMARERERGGSFWRRAASSPASTGSVFPPRAVRGVYGGCEEKSMLQRVGGVRRHPRPAHGRRRLALRHGRPRLHPLADHRAPDRPSPQPHADPPRLPRRGADGMRSTGSGRSMLTRGRERSRCAPGRGGRGRSARAAGRAPSAPGSAAWRGRSSRGCR